jgi:hypothetical protein
MGRGEQEAQQGRLHDLARGQARRADTTAVIGHAALHKAHGRGHRGSPNSWTEPNQPCGAGLARATPTHLNWIYQHGVQSLVQIAPDALVDQTFTGNPVRDSLSVLGSAAFWDRPPDGKSRNRSSCATCGSNATRSTRHGGLTPTAAVNNPDSSIPKPNPLSVSTSQRTPPSQRGDRCYGQTERAAAPLPLLGAQAPAVRVGLPPNHEPAASTSAKINPLETARTPILPLR